MSGDISDPNVASAFSSTVMSHFHGVIHGLVNNVGTNIRRKAIEYTDEVRVKEIVRER